MGFSIIYKSRFILLDICLSGKRRRAKGERKRITFSRKLLVKLSKGERTLILQRTERKHER
jgi:hypothetical protein